MSNTKIITPFRRCSTLLPHPFWLPSLYSAFPFASPHSPPFFITPSPSITSPHLSFALHNLFPHPSPRRSSLTFSTLHYSFSLFPSHHLFTCTFLHPHRSFLPLTSPLVLAFTFFLPQKNLPKHSGRSYLYKKQIQMFCFTIYFRVFHPNGSSARSKLGKKKACERHPLY